MNEKGNLTDEEYRILKAADERVKDRRITEDLAAISCRTCEFYLTEGYYGKPNAKVFCWLARDKNNPCSSWIERHEKTRCQYHNIEYCEDCKISEKYYVEILNNHRRPRQKEMKMIKEKPVIEEYLLNHDLDSVQISIRINRATGAITIGPCGDEHRASFGPEHGPLLRSMARMLSLRHPRLPGMEDE